MKTSKTKQEQTRRHILRAAVELISEQGYDATTMKQIARAAEIGDATIYKYFSTKEKLLTGYYELCVTIAIELTLETPNFDEYNLQERLQRLMDALLELLLADREFVALSRDIIGKSPILIMGDQLPGKATLKTQVLDFLNTAEATGEIVQCDFKNMLAGLFGDYVFTVIAYWLKDESDEFSDTTQLIDLTLGMLVMCLKSGIVNKLTELVSFLVRNQFSRMMQNGSGLIELLQLAKSGINKHQEA
jgi:AcrR family transcriptional regulator